jgi:nesprin-1
VRLKTECDDVSFQTFFSRTPYYKSMLESKNKVFQSIVKSVDSNEGIDTGDFRLKMAKLNERFVRVTQLAQQWELVSLDQAHCFSNEKV